MASPALCPHCDKQEGIVPCLGCQQRFCVKHFQVHRQNLFTELENVVARRNNFQADYLTNVVQTFHPSQTEIGADIDQWEEQMHEQVKRVADRARQQLDQQLQQSKIKLEQELQSMTAEIQQRIDKENFFEEDINRLTRQIDQIERVIREKNYFPNLSLKTEPIQWDSTLEVKENRDEPVPVVQPIIESDSNASSSSKAKYSPSVQRKCYTCGAETWQKECKCCSHVYCGWHLKRHMTENKKH